MLINLRNALMAGKKSPLPPGARWVEYLESTGTQYIDLGTIIPSDVDFEFTGSIVSDVPNGCIFGETNIFSWGATNSGYSLVTTSGGQVYLRYGNSTVTIIGITSIGLGNTFTASLSGTSFQINGRSVATVDRISSFTRTVSSMGVFRRNYINYTVGTFAAVRINNLKFGNLFDFRPIAIGTTGYMLDLVSGEYLQYGNKGTGDFVIGPDIPSPV